MCSHLVSNQIIKTTNIQNCDKQRVLSWVHAAKCKHKERFIIHKNTLFFIIQLHAQQNFEARLRVSQKCCSFGCTTSVYYPDLYAVDGEGNRSLRKEKPHRQGERLPTQQRKVCCNCESNPPPSCCEVIVLLYLYKIILTRLLHISCVLCQICLDEWPSITYSPIRPSDGLVKVLQRL